MTKEAYIPENARASGRGRGREQTSGNGSMAVKTLEIIEIMKKLWGAEYINAAIEKEGLSEKVTSGNARDRIHALQRLVLKQDAPIEDPAHTLEKIQAELARLIARQRIEDQLHEDVDKLIEEKQEKLLDELKLSILKKQRGPENARTFLKLAKLQKLETIRLSGTILEHLRPASLTQLVGQQNAVEAIISKLATPYPQHMILYGPPGVGKTTTARLALKAALAAGTSGFQQEAPFIEVDGTTLRWDRNEATNPLIGSVHDPIYQGSRKDFAESGVPEPKPGLVTDAHGGILFIDEIGEIDPTLQNKLLKVLEDKRVEFNSSYYDPEEENIPEYIRKLFTNGAPADFILIGATTRQPHEINPALRSRCAEVYFEPLTKGNIEEIVCNAAARLQVEMEPEVPDMISQYTMEGRKAVNILSDAFGNAIYRSGMHDACISIADVRKSTSLARLVPHGKDHTDRETAVVGKVNGLGASGFLGKVIEIEAVAFRREAGKGAIRFNETAGSMAKDSVFNAATVIRSLEGIDIGDYDIHVNMVGGGNVDGPSAGAAITIAILSAVTDRPVRQNIAITGEISLLGSIKPVGGILEKLHGAAQAGIETVLVPKDNSDEAAASRCIGILEAVPVNNIRQVIELVLESPMESI